MLRKGNFSAVYTAGHYEFMISHEENVFNIIDTRKVPHLCGGNGNAVIVKGSLVSTCSWLWKRLSLSSVTNEDCYSLSVIVGERLKEKGKLIRSDEHQQTFTEHPLRSSIADAIIPTEDRTHYQTFSTSHQQDSHLYTTSCTLSNNFTNARTFIAAENQYPLGLSVSKVHETSMDQEMIGIDIASMSEKEQIELAMQNSIREHAREEVIQKQRTSEVQSH